MGESSRRLADLIRKAIRDCEITTTEYNRILNAAEEDGMIDSEENSS